MRKSLSNADLAANVVEFLCSKHMLITWPSANQILNDPGKIRRGRYVQQRFTISHSAAEQRLLMACVTTRRERILCLLRFVHIERDINAQMRKNKIESAGGTRRGRRTVEPSKINSKDGIPIVRRHFRASPPTGHIQNSANQVSTAPPTRSSSSGSGGSDKRCFTTRRCRSSVQEPRESGPDIRVLV